MHGGRLALMCKSAVRSAKLTCRDYVAGVAELADALGLGSSGIPVKVRVLSPAPVAAPIVNKRVFRHPTNADY